MKEPSDSPPGWLLEQDSTNQPRMVRSWDIAPLEWQRSVFALVLDVVAEQVLQVDLVADEIVAVVESWPPSIADSL